MSESKKKEVPQIRCSDGCGATVDLDKVHDGGYEYLQITNRYRCRACFNALEAIRERFKAP